MNPFTGTAKGSHNRDSEKTDTFMPDYNLKVERVSWGKKDVQVLKSSSVQEFKCFLAAEFHLTCWNLADIRQPRSSQKEVLLVFLMKYFHFKGMVKCGSLCVKPAEKFLLFVNLYDGSL